MKPAPPDLLKEYVQSQHFMSTADVMQAIKEMFRDVVQQVMEVEMDEELGRERCQRADACEDTPRNYRNGYSKKTVKTQLGEIEIKVLRYDVSGGGDTLREKSLWQIYVQTEKTSVATLMPLLLFIKHLDIIKKYERSV